MIPIDIKTNLALAIMMYFNMNMFLLGRCYDDDIDWSNKSTIKYSILFIIIISLFGGILVTAELIVDLVKLLFRTINTYTQYKFYWKFYVLNEFHDLDEDKLRRINQNTKALCNRDGECYTTKLFVRCTELINKTNNFDPRSNKNKHDEEVEPMITTGWFQNKQQNS